MDERSTRRPTIIIQSDHRVRMRNLFHPSRVVSLIEDAYVKVQVKIWMNYLRRGSQLSSKLATRLRMRTYLHPSIVVSLIASTLTFPQRSSVLRPLQPTMATTSLSLPKVHAAVLSSCSRASSSSTSSSSSSSSSAFFRPSVSFCGEPLETQLPRWRRGVGPVGVRAEEVKEKTKAKGLSRETGGQWLSCTTRHIRIYAAYVDPVTYVMDQSQLDKLTLMLDPDNEFVWPEEAVAKVFDKYRELIETYAGADLTEYTLRLVGSDLEHYIRKLLLAGELKYNLNCRVLNFSMGKPRIDPAELDDVEVEE